MSRQYSVRTLVRQIGRPLLEEYFGSTHVALDLGTAVSKSVFLDCFMEQFSALAAPIRQRVEADFRAIHALSCATGTSAIVTEAGQRGVDVATAFAQCHTAYDRALWTFLHAREIFDVAACFHEMDRLGGGRWRRRFIGLELAPATDSDAIKALRDHVCRVYEKQGRGRRCQIDYYIRHDPERHCFFAYPEDHPSSYLGYDENGALARQISRSAFEVIFVFRPEEGVLEVMAPGGAECVEGLCAAFCTTILKMQQMPAESKKSGYDLDKLKQRDFASATDPADRVEAVYLCDLRLMLPTPGRGHVTFCATPSPQHPCAVHDFIDRVLNQQRWPLATLRVSRATIRFLFSRDDGRKPKSLMFALSAPDRCNLKDDPYDQIARKYLRLWGIIPDTSISRHTSPGRAA